MRIMAEMKYVWHHGRVHIEAITVHDNEETTQHFDIDDLKDIIREMRKLEG